MHFRQMKNVFFVFTCCIFVTSCRGEEKDKQTKSIKENVAETKPVYLYKVLSISDWAESCKIVHLSGMDADFIHLATEEQLDKIIEKF